MQLIIPMAGRSSRFPNLKPKWMLTHPSSKFMVLEAIRGLNLQDFEKIHFIYLEEHEQIHKFMRGFREELEDLGWLDKTNFVSLDKPTQDQPETVQLGIQKGNVKGPILIKDSDNYFTAEIGTGNGVCFADLNNIGLVKARNKSYITIDSQRHIINIVEKQVIGSSFCVGGYAFREAKLFTDTLEKISISKERYISNIIYQLLLDGEMFQAIETSNYCDWGTVEDWDRFKRSFATLFVDLDGTLVKNSSVHFPPYIGESASLQGNVDIIKQLQDSGKFEIIITTSRPEKYRATTEKQLSEIGIRPKHVLMGLQHSKRIIINDYSKSNPYKSCDSINLKRDTEEMREILRESLGIDYEEI
jgi:hypothetical protein